MTHAPTLNRVITSVIALALTIALSPRPARADSVNSPNITMNADTNRATGPGAGNVSVTVNTITLAETMLAEYSSGSGKSISIKVKPGFQFDPAAPVSALSTTIGINNNAANTNATLTPTGNADETLTFNLTSGGSIQAQDIIRITGIKLRIISPAGAAGPAQTTLLLTTAAAGGAFTNQGIVSASITKGAPDHLAFAAQPGTAQAGSPLTPSVIIQDFGNNTIANDSRNITLAIQSNPGSTVLLGTTTKATSNGLATWSSADSLAITVASSNYTLRAAHDGALFLSSNTADSLPFDITAGAASHLSITHQPANTAAGADILIDVTALDSFNNPDTSASFNITLSAAANPGGWPLLADSSLTKAAVSGVASWSSADHLRINKAVTAYTLAASGAGPTITSNPFDITPAAANSLRFVQQPTDVQQNFTIAPPVTVEILDAFANRTTDNLQITATLSTSTCGGTLSGNTTTSAAGLATLDALKIDKPCTADQISATAPGLAATESTPFNVTASPDSNSNNTTDMSSNGNNGDANSNSTDTSTEGNGSAAPAPACGACGQGAFLTLTLAPLMLVCTKARRRKIRAASASDRLKVHPPK